MSNMYLKSNFSGKNHGTSIGALGFAILLFLTACEKPAEKIAPVATNETLVIDKYFNFQTTKEVAVNITAKDGLGNPIRMGNIQIFDKDPENGGRLLLQGGIDTKGRLSTLLPIPTYINEVVIKSNYIGVLDKQVTLITNNKINVNFTPIASISDSKIDLNTNARISAGAFTYLGTFSKHGVPAYLDPKKDVVTADLLESINISLPEWQPVNPDYLIPGLSRDLPIVKNTNISITFVSEGAAYHNALGYYTYPLNNPPATVADIQEKIILFPNASFPYSGGNLVSGSKVKFPVTIPANTGIGFFIVVKGFTGSGVSEEADILYSNPQFNPGTTPEIKQHSVLLNNQGKYILAFEDKSRDKQSDSDFNDVVFYVTSEVADAINNENIPPVKTKQDCDKDGIADADDKYPCDATKAYDNISAGTLAFEDLWPNKGDFDMNDFVVNYKHNAVTNSQNKVVELISTFDIMAIGARFKNGFGFEIPTLTPSQIAGLTSTSAHSRLEDGQSKATIIVFDNAFDFIPSGGNGMINTYLAQPKETFESITITTVFKSALSMQELGTAPFNPFLICNQKREYEVHLPGYLPTSKADLAILGTKDDASQPANGVYYTTKEGMPFALHLPAGTFNYPVEMAAINEAHLKFASWAQSGGAAYADWYLDLPDYRNPAKIYKK